MKIISLDSISESIISISREIINKYYEDEGDLFYPVWTVMKEQLSKWINSNPSKWGFEAYKRKSLAIMEFGQSANASNLVAPGIIALTAGVLWNLGNLDNAPNEREIEGMIDDCGKAFKMSPSFTNNIKRFLISLCVKEMPGILNSLRIETTRKVGEREESYKTKDDYARLWTLRTEDPENGDIISRQKYDEILKNKDNTALIIIKTNGFKDLYVYGNDKDLSQLRYDLLEYVLKHRGSGGKVLNLLKNVWGAKLIAEDLEKALKKAKKKGNDKEIKNEIYAKTGHIRKAVSELNGFLKENINVELRTFQKGQYKLTRPLDYYLLEIIGSVRKTV